MIICGIDPGQKGAIAFLNLKGETLAMAPWDCLIEYIRLLDRLTPATVFVEKAHAMPKQGVSSMFSYGEHFGMLQGALIARGFAHELVPPRAWTRAMHAGTEAGKPKVRSLEAVRRCFPTTNLFATKLSRVPHSGLIDALLIAEWGRRKLIGKHA